VKITNIVKVGKHKVYDISVEDAEHYILSNGVVTHNTGSYYAADNIYILGRQQDKTGGELAGYNFIINVEKSRYVREKSKIPVTIKFDGGISRWSGLLEMAQEAGRVVKPANGWYARVDDDGVIEDKKFREKDTDSADFWKPLVTSKKFQEWIKNRYQMASGSIMNPLEESINEALGEEE
jgi:hypothetical protein